MFCDVWEEFRRKFTDTFSRKQDRTVSPVTISVFFLLCKSSQLPSVILGRYSSTFTTLYTLQRYIRPDGVPSFCFQAPVAQKVDSAIHRINLYPLDSAIGFHNTYVIYPLDSDLSGG